jgi:hypothetical protein
VEDEEEEKAESEKEKEGNSMKEESKKEIGRSWRRERRVIKILGRINRLLSFHDILSI